MIRHNRQIPQFLEEIENQAAPKRNDQITKQSFGRDSLSEPLGVWAATRTQL